MNPNDAGASPSRGQRVALVALSLFVFAIMALAASGDLWMDEIWSVALAKLLHSGADPLTILRVENDHVLNTLYLYFLGDARWQWQYRMASLVSGLACLALLARAAWRQWGPREALLVLALAGLSFPVLLYATEARGYSMVMLMAVVAWLAWRRHLLTGSVASLVAFWVASILGLVAQATFVAAMLAFGIGQFAMEAARDPRQRLASLLRMHLPLLLFAAWWYWFFLSRLVVGGGDASGGWPVFGQASALLLGLPDTRAFHFVALAAVAMLSVAGAWQLRKSGDRQWLFFLAMLLLAPALLLAISPRDFYVRYLAAAFPFFLLLAAHLWCCAWSRSPRGGRLLLALALFVFLAGNLQRDAFLLAYGRGQYSLAIEHMLRNSPPGPMLVGSDHDNRNSLVLQFHASRLPGGDRVVYVDEAHAARYKPAWFLMHSQDAYARPAPDILVEQVGEFRFVRSFRYAGLSGWNWYLYRRVR